MSNIRKNLCFIIILIATSFSKDEKMLTVVYGTTKGTIVVANSDQPENTTQFDMKLVNEISSLAIYDNYLYVSIKVHTFINMDSSIWRCKIIDSINITSCKIFNKVLLSGESVLSMVIVRDRMYPNVHLFAGRSDGIIWRCSAIMPKKCENFHKVGNHKVTGIDYNPSDDKLYASLSSGTLLRCSPYDVSSCKAVYEWDDHKFKTVKVAFEALWVGTQGSELWKCPLDYGNDTMKCYIWERFRDGTNLVTIGATEKFIYAHSNDNKMWRCSPSKIWSCNSTFATPDGSRPFIIV